MIEPKPLILIIGSEPGWPLDWIILSPETKPSKLFTAFEKVAFSIWSALITLTAPAIDCFFWLPYATTTTSSKSEESTAMVTSIVSVVPTVTLCDVNPTKLKTRMSPWLASIE